MMKVNPHEYKDWKDLDQEIERENNVLTDPPRGWPRSSIKGIIKSWLIGILITLPINLSYSIIVLPISLITSIYSHRLNFKKWSLIKKIIKH